MKYPLSWAPISFSWCLVAACAPTLEPEAAPPIIPTCYTLEGVTFSAPESPACPDPTTALASLRHVAALVGEAPEYFAGTGAAFIPAEALACGEPDRGAGCTFTRERKVWVATRNPYYSPDALLRHELLHLAGWEIWGDTDAAHARPEWQQL